MKLFSLLSLLLMSSCVSLLAPKFVSEEIQQSEAYRKAHPESFKTLKGEKRDMAFTQIGANKAPKIIFVHGSPGDWGAYVKFLNQPDLLAKAHLIAVDRLGFGGSERGGVERYLEEQAKAITRVYDEDDPTQPIILVGHSYGGPVVAKMAAMNDPRVKSVVILAGALDPSLEETKWYQIPADWWIVSWMLPQDLVTCNREILALPPELEILAPQLSTIKAHITVVQGLKDSLVNPANADYIEKKTLGQGTKIIRLPEEDHYLQAYEVDLVTKILLEEIKR